jgi:hypothetical protein
MEDNITDLPEAAVPKKKTKLLSLFFISVDVLFAKGTKSANRPLSSSKDKGLN